MGISIRKNIYSFTRFVLRAALVVCFFSFDIYKSLTNLSLSAREMSLYFNYTDFWDGPQNSDLTESIIFGDFDDFLKLPLKYVHNVG